MNMGHLNYMQEEADTMSRNNGRSLALVVVLLVFSCLLISGGSRLIGHTSECRTETIRVSWPVAAALSSVPESQGETALQAQRAFALQRQSGAACAEDERPPACVCSDANGNVLRCRTYLHTVYQAFSLGDGFV